jgi:hypothetical protein
MSLPRNEVPLLQLRRLETEISALCTSSLGPEELPVAIDRLQIHLDDVHAAVVKTYFQCPETVTVKAEAASHQD